LTYFSATNLSVPQGHRAYLRMKFGEDCFQIVSCRAQTDKQHDRQTNATD